MGDTAKVIVLKGDRRNPESAEHIIVFPGGSISVTRTSNNEYWAHIEVNHPEKGQLIGEAVRESKLGEVVGARADYTRIGVRSITTEGLEHVAIRIRTTRIKKEGR
jgi:hypothetical protein